MLRRRWISYCRCCDRMATTWRLPRAAKGRSACLRIIKLSPNETKDTLFRRQGSIGSEILSQASCAQTSRQQVCSRLERIDSCRQAHAYPTYPDRDTTTAARRCPSRLGYSLFRTTKREPSVERTRSSTPLSSDAFLISVSNSATLFTFLRPT